MPPAAPAIVKVDASTLAVSDIAVGKFLQAGARTEMVSYAMSGQADYLFWQICPEQPSADSTATCVATDTQPCAPGGACIQNVTSFNKILFPNMFAGNVMISLKACVDPDHALNANVTCGPYANLLYNSDYINTQVAALFGKRTDLLTALNSAGAEEQTAYMNYAGDLQVCMTSDAANAAYYESKIQVIDMLIKGVFWNAFIWAPKQLLTEIANTSVGQQLISGAQSTLSTATQTFNNVANTFCNSGTTTEVNQTCVNNLKNSTNMTQAQKDAFCPGQTTQSGPLPIATFCSIVGTLAGSIKMMAESMNPMQSVAVLSDAISTISNPEASVSQLCLAEEKFAPISQGINEKIAALTQQLIDTDNQLRALGELPALPQ